jgi:hypothetical protein
MSLRIQNYSSDDTELILDDLHEKGIDISRLRFLSGPELRNY